jgi:hypothetical protein
MAFEYPQTVQARRHGQRGYQDYRSYKPWLRDEFAFRCVYCLWRERWCPDGDVSFSVDHLRAQSRYPSLARAYDNLLFACCQCNAIKQNRDVPLDPCRQRFGQHLEVSADGSMRARTPLGVELISVCRLNRPLLTEARRIMAERLQTLANSPRIEAQQLLRYYRGFPDNLPDLSILNPPEGNSQPEGIRSSFHERRERGELPALY